MVAFFKVPIGAIELGVTTPADRIRVEVAVNVPSGEIVYAADNYIFSSGSVFDFRRGEIPEVSLPTKTGANPVDYEYMLTVEISRTGAKPRTYGPYYKPAPTSTADAPLADWVGTSSVPASWMTEATAQLQAKVDEAEAIKAYVTDVSNIDTTVSAVDFALGQPGPAATLNAAYVGRGNANPGGRVDPDVAHLAMPTKPLTMTADGHADLLHTSVYDAGHGKQWNGFRYWMALTPMPAAGSKKENPCILVSQDGDSWDAPPGLTNPIEPEPSGASDYNADTDLVMGPDGRLYCFWNYYDAVNTYITRWRASSDGTDWSDTGDVYATNVTTRRLLSPAFAHQGGQWRVWAVDMTPAYNVITYEAAATLGGLTGVPETCTVTPPLPSSREPWHIAVQRFGDEWHAILQDTVTGQSGAGSQLWFLTSQDGKNWQRGSEPLAPKIGPYWHAWYRSGFVPSVVNGAAGHDVWACTFGGNSSPIPLRRISRARIEFTRRPGRMEARAAEVTAASNVVAPWVAGDSFQRGNGALSAAESGQSWEHLSGTPTIENGVVRGATRSVVNTALTDGYFETEVRACIASGDGAVIFRAADSNNHWAFGWVSYTFRLYKIVAGTPTQVRQDASPLIPYAVTLSDEPIRLGVRVVGSEITCFVNGMQWGDPVIDSALAANTKQGFAQWESNSRMGAFRARTLPGAVSTYRKPNRAALPGGQHTLAAGESTLSRDRATSEVPAAGSGEWRIAYFTATQDRTVSKLSVTTGAAGVTGTPTNARMALFEVTGADSIGLTKLADCTNDTTLFAAANTTYARDLGAPVALAGGRRYAIGVMVHHDPSAGTARPSFVGTTIKAGVDLAPVLARTYWPGGGAAPAATIATGALTSLAHVVYAEAR